MTPYPNGRDGAREDLCRYLSACYYEPTVEFAEERMFHAMQAAAGAIDPELHASACRLAAAFVAANLQDLLVDYTALFIGPSQPRAIPYASFWLSIDQSNRHEAMNAVFDLYDEGGFDICDELHEFPDHIAIELEFLYAMLFRQNEARTMGEEPALKAAAGLYEKFALEHLSKWIVPFLSAIRSGTQCAFYRELADLTEMFVRSETIQLNPYACGIDC